MNSPSMARWQERCAIGTREWWNPWRVGLFAFLLVACALTRFLALGDKPIMHDESLFVYYSYDQLFKTINYRYQPILHGPMHLWLQAGVFHVFGDTNSTMRLSVAILGFASFFWIWSLRRWLGEVGTWVALAFYVVSPCMMYYNRFFREDGVFLFIVFWIVSSLVWWWHTRRPVWGASLVMAIVSLFCNKESSLFIYFCLVTFFALLVVHDFSAWLLRDGGGDDDAEPVQFPPAVLVTVGSFLFIILCVTRIFEGIRYDGDVVQAINRDFPLRDVRSIPMALGWAGDVPGIGALGEGAFWRKIYILLFVFLFGAALVVKGAVEGRWGFHVFLTRMWSIIVRGRFYLLAALMAGLAMYLLLFTTAFQYKLGPFEIYRDTLQYWMGQNAWHRIKGPFHFHIVNILVYELPGVVIVLAAWAVAAVRMQWNRATGMGLVLAAAAMAVFHMLFRSSVAPMSYFGVLAAGLMIAGMMFVVKPGLGRALLGASLLLFLFYSAVYFNSGEWEAFLQSPYQKALAPIIDEESGAVIPQFQNIFNTGRDFIDETLSLTSGMHLFLIAFLVVVGTIHTWHAIDRGEKFHAFLIWWLITQIGAASYAREKMPQVGIHIAPPLIFLMGSYAQKIFENGSWRRWRVPGLALLVLFAAWNAKAAINLCFRNIGDVREKLVYGDTTQDLKAHMEIVQHYWRIASVRSTQMSAPDRAVNPNLNGPEWMMYYNDPKHLKDVKVLVKQDATIWQARWYLRKIEWTEYLDPKAAIDQGYHFMFLNVGEDTNNPELAQKYYVFRGRARMHWTATTLEFQKLFQTWTLTIPRMYLDNSGQAGVSWDAAQQWKKMRDYMFFRDIYERSDTTYTGLSCVEYLFCVRKDLGVVVPPVSGG